MWVCGCNCVCMYVCLALSVYVCVDARCSSQNPIMNGLTNRRSFMFSVRDAIGMICGLLPVVMVTGRRKRAEEEA